MARRDALEQRRHELVAAKEQLQATLSHYKHQQKQYDTKQRLLQFLHNDEAQLSQPDLHAEFVLENIGVLPSTDPETRRQYVGKFYPHLEVSKAATATPHIDNTLYTELSYRVLARGLPHLDVKVLVRDETVHNVEIANWKDARPLVARTSPSLADAIDSWCLQKQVDLVMYACHASSTLQALREQAVVAIAKKYLRWLARKQEQFGSVELFVQQAHGGLTVKLVWDIAVANHITVEMCTRLTFSVARDGTVVPGLNAVFLPLVQDHGVEAAFDIMMVNLFPETESK